MRNLKNFGIEVERGVELQKFQNTNDGVLVKLSNEPQEKKYDLMFAADGSHSSVRKALGISFEGETSSSRIYLADYENLSENWKEIRYVLGNPEFLMCIPVRENVIRIVTNMKNHE